jgi:acyl carrier protein
MAIDWGRWLNGGMAADMSQSASARLDSLGIEALSPEQAFASLELAMEGNGPQSILMRMNWSKYLRPPYVKPFFNSLHVAPALTDKVKKDDLVAQLKRATLNQRKAILVEQLMHCASRALGLSANHKIDELQPLRELGIDSLLAVELRNRIGEVIGKPLPVTLIYDYPSLSQIAEYVGGTVLGLLGEREDSGADDERLASVANLSDEEAEAMLIEELSSEGGRRD